MSQKDGRPRKEINWTLFEDLCSLQCTQSEIASVLHLHIDTVRDRAQQHYDDTYSNIYKKYSEGGKSSLRRIQFNLAKKNTSMAIWLGKQWLGQKDNHEMVQVPPELIGSYQKLLEQIALNQAKEKEKELEVVNAD